jgi:hypothetical protein
MKTRVAVFVAMGFAAGAWGAATEMPELSYREAYRLVREAKQADYNGNADLAAWKWGEAKALLEKISREHPGWNRGMVQGQLGAAIRRTGRTDTPPAKAFEVSVAETRSFAARMAEFDARKVSMVKQLEWEKKKLLDIENLARALARKENARQVLGIEKGAAVTLADMRRAEAAQPTPTPESKKGEEQKTEEEEKAEAAARLDTDKDGLTDAEEAELGTDPNKADSDDDKLNDYDEVKTHKTDPLNPDTDDDGDSDGEEVEQGWNPLEPFEY